MNYCCMFFGSSMFLIFVMVIFYLYKKKRAKKRYRNMSRHENLWTRGYMQKHIDELIDQ